MSIGAIGGGFSSASRYSQIGQQNGLSKDDLSEISSRLRGKNSSAADGLDKLAQSFSSYDRDTNGCLDVSEAKVAAEKLGLSLPPPPAQAFGISGEDGRFQGASADLSKDQLRALQSNLRSNGVQDDGVGRLLDNFEQIDADGDGKVGQSELKSFAKKNGIRLPKGGASASRGGLGQQSGASDDEQDERDPITGAKVRGNRKQQSAVELVLENFLKAAGGYQDQSTQQLLQRVVG